MKKVQRLYVYSTAQEMYFTSKAVAKKVRKLIQAEEEPENHVYEPPEVELTTVDVDSKFFTHPSTDRKIKVPYPKKRAGNSTYSTWAMALDHWRADMERDGDTGNIDPKFAQRMADKLAVVAEEFEAKAVDAHRRKRK